MNIKKNHGWKLASLAMLALLAACGGSGSDDDSSENPDTLPQTSVTVIGDSLSDIGVLGVRHTVQAHADPMKTPFPLWPELVADELKAPRPCRAYLATSETAFTPQPECRGYAVAGGRLQHPQRQTPLSIAVQLRDAAARAGAEGFGEHEVLLIDGGGNDAADLITAYFRAYLTLVTKLDITEYANFLSELLGEQKTWELLLQPGGWEMAGQAYMEALGRRFAETARSQVLAHGAKRVVILNMPDVTRTPRFLAILDILKNIGTQAADETQGAQGQDPATYFQALFQSWIVTFNQTLGDAFQNTDEVAIVDLYAELTHWATHGADVGLTNTTKAACPPEDPAALLPSYDITQCTVAWLDANAPAGIAPAAGWWKTYAFADGFHPTPRGHELMAQAVAEALAAKGWK